MCLLPGVMVRLHGDIAHGTQGLANQECSVLAALVIMNLQSMNNEAACAPF